MFIKTLIHLLVASKENLKKIKKLVNSILQHLLENSTKYQTFIWHVLGLPVIVLCLQTSVYLSFLFFSEK